MSWSQDTTSRLLITNKKYMTFLYTLNKPTPPKSKNKKKNNNKGDKIDDEKIDNKEGNKITEKEKDNVVKGILKENCINKSQENEVKNVIEDNTDKDIDKDEKKDMIEDNIEKKEKSEDKIDNKKDEKENDEDEKKKEDKIEDNKKDEIEIEDEKKEQENIKEKKEQEKKGKKEKEEKEKIEKKKQKEKEKEEKRINSNNNHNKFLSNKSKPMRPYLLAFLQAKDLLRGDVTISAQLGMKDVKKGLALRYGINVSVFHPSIDFLGHQHSIMLGLNCGVVVKYNLYPGDKYPEIINKCITEYEPQNLYDPITENQIIPDILPEIPKEDYQSDDEDYTKTKTDEDIKDEEKEKEENKEKEKIEGKKKIEKIEKKEIKEKKKIVRREYFNCHLRRIIFIGFIENFTTKMVTVDESGVIVMWLYNKNAFSGYVWYLPQNRYRLNLKYNIYVPMEDSEVYNILDMPNITLNQQYDKCFQESLKVYRDLQDNHKLNVYHVLQKEGECEVYIKYI